MYDYEFEDNGFEKYKNVKDMTMLWIDVDDMGNDLSDIDEDTKEKLNKGLYEELDELIDNYMLESVAHMECKIGEKIEDDVIIPDGISKTLHYELSADNGTMIVYCTYLIDPDYKSVVQLMFFDLSPVNSHSEDYFDILRTAVYEGGDGNESNEKGDTKDLGEENDTESGEKSGQSSEFREFLESYEAFIDDYVEFMKKYRANPTQASLLAEYSNFMQKYLEFSESLEKYDAKKDKLTPEEQKLYLEVTLRCTQKILEISGY